MSAEMKNSDAPPVEMVNIEVDGVAMQAPKGSMIIESTDQAGIDIPRFCYHPKLTIAANCRMCLVDVEKAPKPMPACATPVMEGMKVYTQSRRAIDAQHGVMEFLLINHPLDCPICDQGGECELQDLAMGYGRSVSRFTERKRVVKDKPVGPLIQTDMTRCIHCTRCIRFLDEIAGTTEMGGTGRGDRLEIGTGIETSIDSELSGNIIDLCPVGALTNKPFRYSARAWELMARSSVGSHDGVGSLIYYHARSGRIMRAVPKENETSNETWLSDRDRYSHFGLYAEDRLTQPMVKKSGEWQAVTWDEAIQATADALRTVSDSDPQEWYTLMSSSASTEEYFLAQRLVRQLGGKNIDHRLRETDFTDDEARAAAPIFGCQQSDIDHADAILLVGANPRHEAPLLGHRIRKAARRGAVVSTLNPLDWDFVFDTRTDILCAPQLMVGELAGIALATAAATSSEIPDGLAELTASAEVSADHQAIAEQLQQADKGLIMVGQFSMSHYQAAAIRALSEWIAGAAGCRLNMVAHGANSVGAWLGGAVPHRGPAGSRTTAGLNASQMVQKTGGTWLLWDFEPDFDVADPATFTKSLESATAVVAVCSYASNAIREAADVLLPLAPNAESEGSLFNFDGETMRFTPAGKPSGEARPGWKILRRLGDTLGLEGFAQVDLAQLHDEVLAAVKAETEPRREPVAGWKTNPPEAGLYRIGEVPMYSADAVCRRSTPLQKTIHSDSQFVGLNPQDAERLGLTDGGKARIRQGGGHTELTVRVTDQVPPGGAWVRSSTCSTRELSAAIGPISVEVA